MHHKQINDSEKRVSDADITLKPEVSKDPTDWEINNDLIDHIALNGIPQNIDSDFSLSAQKYTDRTRFMLKSFFIANLRMGKQLKGSGSHILG